MEKINLSKQQKILLLLLQLSGREKKNLKFEDIVVALFRRFPKDFHLRGYKNYPDSGDSIKRPLYTFRDNGILMARNMIFALTDKGISRAVRIKKCINNKEVRMDENFDRYIDKEIKRIKNLNSFKLFLKEDLDGILDTDFFDYLGISVKSGRMDFKARLNLMKEMISDLERQKKNNFKPLTKFHKFMIKRFRDEIRYKLNN